MIEIKCAYTKLVPIHELVPNPKNPNKHPDKQIDLLAKIIQHQGMRSPVVVSKRSGFIVKGHGRVQALNRLEGVVDVPVDYQDYDSEAMEYADMVADNKIAELAASDMNMIIDEVKDLDLGDFDLLGIPDFNIDALPSVKDTAAELDLDSFDNFDHQCPKCGFEWNDDGKDNS